MKRLLVLSLFLLAGCVTSPPAITGVQSFTVGPTGHVWVLTGTSRAGQPITSQRLWRCEVGEPEERIVHHKTEKKYVQPWKRDKQAPQDDSVTYEAKKRIAADCYPIDLKLK